MNASMRRVYDPSVHDPVSAQLPAELTAIAEAGFVLSGGRLYLAAPEHNSPAPEGFDDWAAERWVNKIHLDSAKPANGPDWRHELVGHGLDLARRLPARASALTSLPVQAVVALQSAECEVDQDVDFATGTLQVYLIRTARDDLTPAIEATAQPALTVTTDRSAPSDAAGAHTEPSVEAR